MVHNLLRLAWSLGTLLLLLSCATTQRGVPNQIAWKTAQVGRYTVQVPGNDEWKIVIDKEQGMVTAERLKKWWTGRILGSTQIKIFTNRLLAEADWGRSEQQIADDYRDTEESVLRAAGKNEEYALEKTGRSSAVIGQKRLHVLSYRISKGTWISGPPVIVDAALYVFFPEDFRQAHTFFGFLVSESHEKGALVDVDLEQIRPFIESFELR